MDSLGNHHQGGHNINNFELQDFIDDANFDQFIDIIRGDGEDPAANFDPDLMMNGCFDDYSLFGQAGSTTPPGLMFGFNDVIVSDPTTSLFATPNFDGEMKGGEEEYYNDGEDSSGTTTTMTTTKRQKVDRSRTLVSERKRRGSMKERLYALRSLVPNITKMDKASIVGDSVLYVQDLQQQAKKLKAEIASLEASLAGADDREGHLEGLTKPNKDSNNDQFFSKGILQVKKCEQDVVNLPNLKLWVTGAFLNQGFKLASGFSA
ncbi:transcription factor FER-LIKE IRON DEFICIENCY-INDUCED TRANSCRIPTION FACTOR-like isoform X2 [Pyrus x bretschneideri]|uniref:transcription factor FER-LIKE IRON DEFICIENCY-INDUCED TRANSCRIPTION FACTOR-like isoform X2 n=1 Tax=Pyrus x bretschneideri TaxID=225117 RepID=UPI00202EE684|nr:transcription factor FER-LIKE IRON DEFICIENCY-INDUCED TRANSCRIPTION FACTOR-like isoform X2 [Pyrus x bretschneideri]